MTGRLALAIITTTAVVVGSSDVNAQTPTEKNIIYGMYSGLALLMDVYRPEQSNGYGVILVPGSGWQAPLEYNAIGLKDGVGQLRDWVPPLLRGGYTVFAINHRATPRFHYPAPLEDVQRAIRFVRHHAKQYGVQPMLLGAIAGSSGAHLVGLAAMLAAPGISEDSDPVNRQPATLQCIVLRAAPTDFVKSLGIAGDGAIRSLMRLPTGSPETVKAYAAASPITHVSRSSPPVLLLHGDADETVPYQQSVAMEAALRAANVPVKLVAVPGGAHGPTFAVKGKPHPDLARYTDEMVRWFDQHLKNTAASR
jgi:acetyl esterase/lipase